MAAIISILLKPAAATSSINSPITTPSAEPSSFLAGVRERGSTVPLDFFTPAEETFLKELFGTYHLTSVMDPVDFIGFCCYAELENLMETVGKLAPQQKACSDAENPTFVFCSNFMHFYLRLLRNCSNNPPNSSLKTINKYSLSETEFINILSSVLPTSVLQSANLKLKQAWTQSHTSSSSPIEKEKRMVLYRLGIQQLSRLQNLIPLFSKIVSSPYCKDLLVDHNLRCFQGSDKLDQVTLKDSTTVLSEISAVRDIQKFLNFIEFCLNSALKKKWIGINLTSFSNHLRLLQNFHQQTPSTELIHTWNRIFCACMDDLMLMREQCQKSYSRAQERKLDHKTWLQENKIQAQSQKTTEEFLESLLLAHLQVILVECLEDTVNRMIEQHLFTPLFSNVYRSLDETIQHFLTTLLLPIGFACMPLVARESTPAPLTPLFLSFYQKINTCLGSLNQFLLTSTIIADSKELIDWYQAAGKLPLSKFTQFAAKLLPGCMLTNSILKQLPHLQTEFAQELLGWLKKTSLAEFQKEKTNWLNFTLEQYHSQARRIFYQTTYFKDLELLVAKKTFLKDLNYTVPSELRNYILFQTEIESIFEQAENFLKSAVTPVSLEPTSAIPSSPAEPVTTVTEIKSHSQEQSLNPLSSPEPILPIATITRPSTPLLLIEEPVTVSLPLAETISTTVTEIKPSTPLLSSELRVITSVEPIVAKAPQPITSASLPSEPIPAVIDSLPSTQKTSTPERAPSPIIEDPTTEKVEELLPFKTWVKTAKAPVASSSDRTKIEDRPPSPKDRKEIMQRLKKAIKVREFEAILSEMDYYFLRNGKGSHHIWRNDERDNQISLPSRPNADISPGVRNSIGKQVFDL